MRVRFHYCYNNNNNTSYYNHSFTVVAVLTYYIHSRMRIIVSRPLSVIGGNSLLFCDCGSMAAVR